MYEKDNFDFHIDDGDIRLGCGACANGCPVLSMWLTIIGLLLNIVLDYIFIFTLNGGIIGAAYATVVSQAFFALPLCLFTLPLWFGLDGVWLSMPLSRVILFAYVCYLWFVPCYKK